MKEETHQNFVERRRNLKLKRENVIGVAFESDLGCQDQ